MTALKTCPACGGPIRMVTGPGRTFACGSVMAELPADLAIPTCASCGEEWHDAETTEKLDRWFELAKWCRCLVRTAAPREP